MVSTESDSRETKSGRPISDNEPSQPTESGAVKLTDLSVRSISLYQKQAELTDRLWSYFGTNSALAVLAGLVAPLLARGGLLPGDELYVRILLGLAAVAYLAFSTGNRTALLISQEALERIAAQAAVASGIPLEVVKPARAKVFHQVVSALVFAIVSAGFVIAASTSRVVGL